MARNGKTGGKAAKAKNGNGHAPRKAKAAKPKPTVEQISDQDRQTLLFSHKKKLKPLLAEEARAKAAVTKAYELAKKEGISKGALKFAIALESPEGEEKARVEHLMHMEVARWMGVPIGSQAEMFPKVSASDQAFQDGKRAALDDEPCKPPKHLSQPMAQHWIKGHGEGRTALNTERASSGFKPIGAVAADLVTQAHQAAN